MKKSIESFISKDSIWPDIYDDQAIDDLVWAEIRLSESAGDFASYLVHRPQKAQYIDQAKQRYEAIDESLDASPVLYFKAITKIQELAALGDAGAMFHLGKIYSIGIAVEQNFNTAVQWYQQSVTKGDVRAHCNLGWMYQSGFGVEEDLPRGFELLKVGSDAGVLEARATIAMMLLSGDGCNSDIPLSFSMLEDCFDHGYNNAANCLADIYFAGAFVEKNIDNAFAWLSAGADRGDLRTMAILGHYLVTGSHGVSDVARGVGYLYAAVNRSYPEAHLWLAALYEEGRAIERNPEMAQMLYEKGAGLGDESCQFALSRLASGAVSPSSTTIN